MDFMSVFLIKFESMRAFICATVTLMKGTTFVGLSVHVFRVDRIMDWRGVGIRFSGLIAALLMLLAISRPAGLYARTEVPAMRDTADISGASHADTSYLSWTRERMRGQLAAGDLEPAARTLQWIRRIDPDDPVAGVLAIELQLQRGDIAAAAMQLIEVLNEADVPSDTHAEAQRILASLVSGGGTGAAVMVTRDMLDEANLPDAPGRLLLAADGDGFAYEIGTSPPGDDDMPRQIRRFSAATPLDEMRAATSVRMP